MGYNGWSNYETWAVALWFDSDEGLYNDTREMARTLQDNHAVDLASTLKEVVEGMAPDLGASLFSDLLNAALGEVNWLEIAENYLKEVKEEAK